MQIEGWDLKKLDSIFRIIDSLHQTPSFCENDGYPMVRVTDVKGGNLDLTNSVRVSEDVFKEYTKKYKPKRNDIIFSRVGSYGISSFVNTDQEFCLGQNTVIAESNNSADAIYIFNVLKSEIIKEQIEKTVDGSSHKTVSLKVIKDLKLPVPPLAEQKKIAEILSTWDKAIETVERLVANSQQQKKALMQQLLTGQKRLLDDNGSRFSEDWKKTELSKVVKVSNEKSIQNNEYPIITSSRKGLFLQSEYFKKQVASEDNTGYKVVPKGYITFRSMSDDGLFVFNRQILLDKAIISPAYGVFEFKDINPDFGLYLLNSVQTAREIKNLSQGGTRIAFKTSSFGEIKLKIPSKKEQEKIAQVLTLADREIDLYQQQLDQLKLEKKALMQQLLTGQKRVKLDT